MTTTTTSGSLIYIKVLQPKEGAARLCVSHGAEAVSDWEGQLMKVMQRQGEKK
ncbi:unnamed protein product [Brassica rapa]|uniref:Uncharacterized protein n=2 Tax=Brassica TaxID=3705 RepID=A0A8D9M130_BRACM|nr:unnamed protein product [Brassica napus]CAG7893410.1 unnamed protein product [Brassica rapa]